MTVSVLVERVPLVGMRVGDCVGAGTGCSVGMLPECELDKLVGSRVPVEFCFGFFVGK